MHYLDNAATTPVHPRVTLKIAQLLEHCFANPSSLYRPGFEAEQEMEAARLVLAKSLGVNTPLDPRRPEIVFTASGTESNNLAILGAARARKSWGNHIVATGYEHPSVTNPLEHLAKEEGFQLTYINPSSQGTVSLEQMVKAVTPKTVLVCAMAVNNETGALLDVQKLAAQVKAVNKRTAVHVDGVQAFTKLPFSLAASAIDSFSLSGHKIYAPKGIAALYLRKGFMCQPVFWGGHQEGQMRPGTENVPYIGGLAQAVTLASLTREDKDANTIQHLNNQLVEGLSRLEGIQINSPPEAWPGILNFALPNIRSETMLHYLEEKQVYVSSGSACSQGLPSHTLTAMGLPSHRVDASLRVSISAKNTPDDISALLKGLEQGIATLARAR